MAGEKAAGAVGIYRRERGLARRRRRQAHRGRHIEQQIEIEIFSHCQRRRGRALHGQCFDAREAAEIGRDGGVVRSCRADGLPADRHCHGWRARQIGAVASGLREEQFSALRLAGGDGLRVGIGIGGADVDDRRLRRLDRGERGGVGGGVETRLDCLGDRVIGGDAGGEHERDHRKSHDDRHRAASIGGEGFARRFREFGFHDQNPLQVVTRLSPPATLYCR